MDISVTFARHFARLVWLLLQQDAASVDEQKVALRALVTTSKDGGVTLVRRGRRLVANGAMVPDALPGVSELVARLAAHAVEQLAVERAAAAADLLGAARLLAGAPEPAKLAATEATTVRLQAAGGASAEAGTSFATGSASGRGLAAHPASSEAPPRMQFVTGEAALGDLELDVLSPEESDLVSFGVVTGEQSAIAAVVEESTVAAPSPSATPRPSDGAYLPFSAAPEPRDDLRGLFAELDAARSPNTLARLLDELVTSAERAARDGQPVTVADAFAAIVRREAESAPDGALRAPYTMAVRRLSRPSVLRIVARMLAQRPGYEEEYAAVLARAGEDGAEALIEQLAEAPSIADRHTYFGALVRLKSGVPALLHMLGDARWYVVRNAADLLGELQAADADVPLGELLRHDDERVRRAATAALGKLGTPRAAHALQQALRDPSPQVRTQAATGLAAQNGKQAASAALGEALDAEADADVALALLAALGRVATPDAVQRLIRVAEPAGGLFKKKPTAERVAAVHALGEARTPAALDALSKLLTDKEREVRDAAVRVFRSGANG